jgi:hypothetical protein
LSHFVLYNVGGHGNGATYGQGGSFQDMMVHGAYSFTDKLSPWVHFQLPIPSIIF